MANKFSLIFVRGENSIVLPWFTPTRDFNAEDVVFSINRVLGHDTYLPTLSDDVVTYKIHNIESSTSKPKGTLSVF